MLCLKLNNGKYVHISGKIFMEFQENGDISLHAQPSNSQSSMDLLEENFYKTEPSYLNKKTESKVIKHSEIPKTTRESELIKEGKSFFKDFLEIWKTNWGVENEDQPDRKQLLINTMNDFSLPIFKFVKNTGGLTHAIMHTYPNPSGNYGDPNYRRECRLYAENIAQVSSILCPPLSELLEYPFPLTTQIGDKR